jgi:putative addiction module component (TIGR02574 family)
MEPAMAASVEILEAEALQLSAAERAQLVERLIRSLDMDPAVEEAWAAEVERRHAEIESGHVATVQGPETLARLKREFR